MEDLELTGRSAISTVKAISNDTEMVLKLYKCPRLLLKSGMVGCRREPQRRI
jgi:hypothetical protein